MWVRHLPKPDRTVWPLRDPAHLENLCATMLAQMRKHLGTTSNPMSRLRCHQHRQRRLLLIQQLQPLPWLLPHQMPTWVHPRPSPVSMAIAVHFSLCARFISSNRLQSFSLNELKWLKPLSTCPERSRQWPSGRITQIGCPHLRTSLRH